MVYTKTYLVYIYLFTNNIWSYLLWSPVILLIILVGEREQRRAKIRKGTEQKNTCSSPAHTTSAHFGRNSIRISRQEDGPNPSTTAVQHSFSLSICLDFCFPCLPISYNVYDVSVVPSGTWYDDMALRCLLLCAYVATDEYLCGVVL